MSKDANKETRPVRVWKEINVAEVNKQLLVIDDLYGTCANCQQLGLKYTENTVCPNCKTAFKYLASTINNVGNSKQILNRIKMDGLPYTLIEKEDLDISKAKDALGDLFS